MEEKIDKDKPFTAIYFRGEIRAQLRYFDALHAKSGDIDREHREKAEEIIEKYKGNTIDIDRSDLAVLKQLEMMFSAIMGEIQSTIVKIIYARTIAEAAFGITDLGLEDKEKERIKYLEEGNMISLFKFTENGDLAIRDTFMYETMKERSYAVMPKDQRTLREIFNSYWASYEQEKKAREEEETRKERYRRELEDKLKEVNKIENGEEDNPVLPADSEG